MKEVFADIVVELPVEGTFGYSVPPFLKERVMVGMRALVPFGGRKVTGYIIGLADRPPADVSNVKPLIDLLDDEPIFDEKRLRFYKWLSSYYFAPLGMALALIHPGISNIKSRRHLSLTAKGEEVLGSAGISGLEKEVLAASKSGVSVQTLAKRLAGKPLYSTIERLKKNGLIHEETSLKGGTAEKVEQYISIKNRQDLRAEEIMKTIERSPIQAKVYKYLLSSGEASMGDLRKGLGNIAPAVKKLDEKGLVEVVERRVLRNPLSDIVPKAAPFEPNEEQREAIDKITEGLKDSAFSPFLLYGVTGSGKTLVYLKILEEAIRLGKKAIILAPEIALTPWPAAYLAEKFPGKVAMAHSGLSSGERLDEWKRILAGDVDIVVGARSALFSPLSGLGLIIVDEEHETSYKQEDGVRYNARDAALMLGKYLGATVVLGSATPSVETFYNAKAGKITPLYMRKRVHNTKLPKIELQDMKGSKGVVLSDRLKGLMEDTFASGHQALLFLNRRGFSNSIICRDCGHSFSCLNCSVTLTMHKRKGVLKCHYCDSTVPLPDECPKCRNTNLIQPGAGTEKVEEEVKALFPKVRVGRMDRDTTGRRGAAKKIIDAVEERKVDILIGTQMVSKGHHFPGITLVGVISGDTSLSIPDFRSSERTFQLITQAAGRAGRGDNPGTVVIQTLNSAHYAFGCALLHDYDRFFDEEIEIRKELSYPPFTRLCNLRLEGTNEGRVISSADELKAIAHRFLGKKEGITILGPAPALIAKIKNRYRWQMLIKGRNLQATHSFIKALKDTFEGRKSGVSLTVDMDPLTIV